MFLFISKLVLNSLKYIIYNLIYNYILVLFTLLNKCTEFSKNATLDLYVVPSTSHVRWNLLGCDGSKLPLTFDFITASLFLKQTMKWLLFDPTSQYSMLTSYISEIKKIV